MILRGYIGGLYSLWKWAEVVFKLRTIAQEPYYSKRGSGIRGDCVFAPFLTIRTNTRRRVTGRAANGGSRLSPALLVLVCMNPVPWHRAAVPSPPALPGLCSAPKPPSSVWIDSTLGTWNVACRAHLVYNSWSVPYLSVSALSNP